MFFSDGSCADKNENDNGDENNGNMFEASYAVAILSIVDGYYFSFHGCFGGQVETDDNRRWFIGATACDPLQSEMSGVFWSLAWVCFEASFTSDSLCFLHCDNKLVVDSCHGDVDAWRNHGGAFQENDKFVDILMGFFDAVKEKIV